MAPKGTKEAAAPKAKKNGSGGGDRGAGRKPSAVNVKGALTIQKRRETKAGNSRPRSSRRAVCKATGDR